MKARVRAFFAESLPAALKVMRRKSPVKNISDGRGIDQLSLVLKQDAKELLSWFDSIPDGYAYRSFSIKKQSGKYRTIEAPNDQLKDLQKRVYTKLLKDVAIQTAANGFVPHKSLIDNVRPHLNSQIVIKIDLKDFFTSISDEKVKKFWNAEGWSDEVSTILSNICCKDAHLPQGAPTSPALSNVVNRGFDGEIRRIANRFVARYTRYADDLTISFPAHHGRAFNKVRPLLDAIRTAIESEGYRIQFDKGIKILRRHQRQIITGLVVNDRIRLPKSTRHRIRALRHLRSADKLSEKDIKRLEGYERLEKMIESSSDEAKKSRNRSIQRAARSNNFMLTIEGDLVQGNKVVAGDNEGGIQNFGDVTGQVKQSIENVETSLPAKRLSRDAKAGIVVAVLVLIAGSLVTIFASTILTWLCNHGVNVCSK